MADDYNDRKSIFIARATRHFDTPEIRKEAAEMFDERNKPKKESMARRIGKFLKKKTSGHKGKNHNCDSDYCD